MARRAPGRDVSKDVDENRRRLAALLGEGPDLVYHELPLGSGFRPRALLVYASSLVDEAYLGERVVEPLARLFDGAAFAGPGLARRCRRALESSVPVQAVAVLKAAAEAVTGGRAVLFLAGSEEALVVDVARLPKRQVAQPEVEVFVRGPRDSFNEDLETNLGLIRRRVREPGLQIETSLVGKRSRTPVALIYVRGLAREEMVEELKRRLKRIDVDSVLDSGHLEEYLSDQPYALFPTILATERPDRVAGALFEGRAAVAVDGSPFVLIVPASFWDFLASPEDYYQNPFFATFLRWVRSAAFVLSFALPSAYVALTTFHQEMIPTDLALRIATGKEGTPFPAVVEALLLEIQFEILREAGLRIPSKIGTAVSVVGVLVVGQALVAAGLVSPIIIIVVGSTAVASFAVPIFEISYPTRLLRFPLMILGATLGIFGIVWGIGLVLAHLCALRSFGRPYLAPVTPLRWRELKDSPFLRAPHWAVVERSSTAQPGERRRQPPGQKPGREEDVW